MTLQATRKILLLRLWILLAALSGIQMKCINQETFTSVQTQQTNTLLSDRSWPGSTKTSLKTNRVWWFRPPASSRFTAVRRKPLRLVPQRRSQGSNSLIQWWQAKIWQVEAHAVRPALISGKKAFRCTTWTLSSSPRRRLLIVKPTPTIVRLSIV